MSKKYRAANEGEWITPIRRGYRMECCDCGLVHALNFRLRRTLNGGRSIQFQAFRDNRATAQVRRHKRKDEKSGKHKSR